MSFKSNKQMIRAMSRNFEVMKVASADIRARSKGGSIGGMPNPYHAVMVHDGNTVLRRYGKIVTIWERPINPTIGDYPIAERRVKSAKALIRFLRKNKAL